MPGKRTLLPYSVVTNGDMSQSTILSLVTAVQYLDNIGYQLKWTGTPTGTFAVQISQDQTNWTSLTLSTAIAASGSADVAYIDLNQLSAPYIRLVYTRTSGTGTLNVTVSGKAV